MLLIGFPKGLDKSMHREELIKIRLKVDTDPPKDGGIAENFILLLPYPFSVKTFRIEDLFAGKVHAVLCREWKGRVKGRDWYDLIWFISRNISLNIEYLRQRMIQSNYWKKNQKMTKNQLLDIFDKKISSLDIGSAKNDIINFINDSSIIELWSKDFFKKIVRKINILG